ncbi:MAG TPA: cold shock domain-containing protein [Mycobacteriales bacterium]|nr:cold shock domain-containing protein [Mycobacteriales bacterium]
MQHGTVYSFDPDRGFGFITPDGGGPALFVDFTAIEAVDGVEPTLHEGQLVDFEVTLGTMGRHATSVRLPTTA